MRAALYARVSKYEQTNLRNSIELQLTALRTYARVNNFEVVGEYVDSGYMATDDSRPGLQALMIDARENEFDIVVLTAQDRFFENPLLYSRYRQALQKSSVKLTVAYEGPDVSVLTPALRSEVLMWMTVEQILDNSGFLDSWLDTQ